MGICRGSVFGAMVLGSLGFGAVAVGQQQQQDPNRRPPAHNPTPNRVPPRLPAHPTQHLRGNGWSISYRGWRKGYTPYPGLTIYRVFSFHRYVMDPPDDASVVVSPFYLYPNLPPFIDGNLAYMQDQSQAMLSGGSGGGAVQQGSTGVGSTGVSADPVPTSTDVQPVTTGIKDSDEAVSTLKRAWEGVDAKAVDLLCPRSGLVTVSVADQSYGLAANDFYDLLLDGVGGTKTAKLSVIDEHVDGDRIELKVLHTFVDPWQKIRAITQTYTLVKEDGGYVIREFGSDTYSETGSGSPDGSQATD